jgi:hypothetical protein
MADTAPAGIFTGSIVPRNPLENSVENTVVHVKQWDDKGHEYLRVGSVIFQLNNDILKDSITRTATSKVYYNADRNITFHWCVDRDNRKSLTGYFYLEREKLWTTTYLLHES